jgi:hypothetical protein
MRKGINLLLLCVVAMGILTVAAQDKSPAVPDGAKVKILQAKLAQERATRQFNQLAEQMSVLKEGYQKALKDQKQAEDEVFLALHLDAKNWTLDETADDVKLVPAPKSAEPAKPAAEAKKP